MNPIDYLYFTKSYIVGTENIEIHGSKERLLSLVTRHYYRFTLFALFDLGNTLQ